MPRFRKLVNCRRHEYENLWKRKLNLISVGIKKLEGIQLREDSLSNAVRLQNTLQELNDLSVIEFEQQLRSAKIATDWEACSAAEDSTIASNASSSSDTSVTAANPTSTAATATAMATSTIWYDLELSDEEQAELDTTPSPSTKLA